jgi:hypothetical protein
MVAASVAMGGALFVLIGVLDPWFAPQSGLLAQAAALFTLVAVGLVVYLGAAHLFGAARFRELISDSSA